MLSLNQLKEILNLKIPTKRNIFLLLLVLIIIISTSLLIKKTTNQEKPPPQITIDRQNQEQFTVQKYSLFNQLDLPKTVEIPILFDPQLLNLEFAQQIASSLGFKKDQIAQNDPVLGLFFKWQEDSYFAYHPEEKKLTYSFNTHQNPQVLTEGERPTVASTQQTSQDFLENLGLWNPNFQILKTLEIDNFSTETPITPLSEVNVIEIQYGLSWQNIPITTIIPNQPLVKIKIAHQDKIVSFNYRQPPQITSSQGPYPALSSEQILQQLDDGLGVVVSLNLKTPLEKPLSTNVIAKMEIEKVRLAYLFQANDQDFLAPIFVLEGTATMSDQGVGEAIVYLPAIRQNATKKQP